MRAMSMVALAALVGLFAPVEAGAQQRGKPGEFDYYVFSLSWSAAHCKRDGVDQDSRQCRVGSGMPGFVVHGLWPQYDKGGWPQQCSTTQRVPRPIVDAMLEIMPTVELVDHQWAKHGSCSGLDPDNYFAETRAAWERVRIPPEFLAPDPELSMPARDVEKRFVELNHGFTPGAVMVACDRRGVYEVRVCLDKDLIVRPCGARMEDTCRPDAKLSVK